MGERGDCQSQKQAFNVPSLVVSHEVHLTHSFMRLHFRGIQPAGTFTLLPGWDTLLHALRSLTETLIISVARCQAQMIGLVISSRRPPCLCDVFAKIPRSKNRYKIFMTGICVHGPELRS